MELRGVEVSLGQFHFHVDVTFADGITGICGASGAGKTTLLEIVAGLRKPQKGQLSSGGQTLFDHDRRIFVPARKRRIGYVPQDLALFPHMSVLDNIRYGEKAGASPSRASFSDICKVLDIEKNLHQYPRSLSGGERQRVAFARALMTEPSFLLLDEPLRGLDDELKDKVLSLLLQIRQEFAVPMLYVTHSPDEAAALCAEIILMDKGKITGQGKPSDYFVRSDAPIYRLRPVSQSKQ